ncbi:hypothetical protein AAHC03_0672 [Spirometra sp. Aus1]
MEKKLMFLYDITLFTGIFSRPVKQAKVYITVVAERVRLKRLPLSNLENGQCTFYPGSAHTFSIRHGLLGDIRSVILEVTQGENNLNWLVNAVIINCTSLKMTWSFPCYCWLSSGSPNTELIRAINGHTHYKEISLIITVVWSSDGRDFLLQILGNEGCSTQLFLKYPKSASADNNCVYTVSMTCLGRVQKGVISSFDGKLQNLAYVRVDELGKCNGCAYFFYEGKDLRLTSGSLKSTVCPAITDISMSRRDVRYIITFETGNEQLEELTAKPFLQLRGCGVLGRRHWINNALAEPDLYKTYARGNFQENVFGCCTRVRVHLLPAPHTEVITAVRVGHDNSGRYPHWNLRTVEIEDPVTGKVYKFTNDKWISRTKGIKNNVVELKPTVHQQSTEN